MFLFSISSYVIEIPCVCDDTVLKYQAATVKPKEVNTRRPHSFFHKLNWKITTHRLWNPAAQLLSMLCRNHCLNYFKIRVSLLYISSLKLATIVTIICFTALLETSNIRIILELGPDWFFSEVDADAGFPLDSVLGITPWVLWIWWWVLQIRCLSIELIFSDVGGSSIYLSAAFIG